MSDWELALDVVIGLPLLLEESGNLAVFSFHLHRNQRVESLEDQTINF